MGGLHRERVAECGWCGREFVFRVASLQAAKRRFCSNRCASSLRMGGSVEIMCPLPWRACDVCGKEICFGGRMASTPRCVTCKPEAERRRYARSYKSRAIIGEFRCIECGVSFHGHVLMGGTRRACKRCQRRIECATRRHALRDRTRERVGKDEIAERDGWRCGICDRLIPRTLKVPNPRALVLDHLLPVSVGGEHTRANLRAAHFSCNSRRGAVGSAQLRLVG